MGADRGRFHPGNRAAVTIPSPAGTRRRCGRWARKAIAALESGSDPSAAIAGRSTPTEARPV